MGVGTADARSGGSTRGGCTSRCSRGTRTRRHPARRRGGRTFGGRVGVLPGHVHLGNAKDNFWEMGNTGPCGPCTEVHYDSTPDFSGAAHLVNRSSDQVIEIWNLVFIQFNRNADRSLTPLPARHVDTGMGFERITKVLQGKNSNYETDMSSRRSWAKSSASPGTTYRGEPGGPDRHRLPGDRRPPCAWRRSPSPTARCRTPRGAGRSSAAVIRRAVRYGYTQLGRREPFVYRLVPTLVGQMGGAFPELALNPGRVADVIRSEERDFFRTVAGGVKRFEAAVEEQGGRRRLRRRGRGRPEPDLRLPPRPDGPTRRRARPHTRRRTRSRPRRSSTTRRSSRGKKAAGGECDQRRVARDRRRGQVRPAHAAKRSVLGWVVDNEVVTAGELAAGDEAALLLEATPFYAEQGGQVGDAGTVATPGGELPRRRRPRDWGSAVLHVGAVESGVDQRSGEEATAGRAEADRADIAKNHTATHLLNLALARGARRPRGAERLAGGRGQDALRLQPRRAADARASPRGRAAGERGAPRRRCRCAAEERAAGRGEADPRRAGGVRREVPRPGAGGVSAGASVEFCGGTHVGQHGRHRPVQASLSQEGVAKGVRRVTAVTGRRAAEGAAATRRRSWDDLAAKAQCQPEQLPARLQVAPGRGERTARRK